MRRLIYFSPVASTSYAQRPHYFVRQLLEQGVVSEVLWVEPHPARLPRWGDLLRRRSTDQTESRPPADSIHRLAVRALPIEPLPGGWALNSRTASRHALRELVAFARGEPCIIGVGRPSALAVWALETLPHRGSFFDAMDDFPAFYGSLSGRAMARREQAVARRVEWVFCSSHSLVTKFELIARRVQLVPNAYPMSELPSPEPVERRAAIGYVGTIARWFDWPLVVGIARALPDVPVRLVGPEFSARPRDMPGNIEVLPACPREEAVDHVKRFAVGLIPFRLTRLTASVDPIKYYEYVGLGLPVWSTAFGEMARRRDDADVSLVDRGTDWRQLYAQTGKSALPEERVAAFRQENDWAMRVRDVANFLAA